MSRQKTSTRDGKHYAGIPDVVIRSRVFRSTSFAARSLLLDIAMQFKKYNNGKLVCTPKFLSPLDWKSASMVHKAKGELLEAGLLIETRKGAKPNKAAWYALAWESELASDESMDIKPETFRAIRIAYMTAPPLQRKRRKPPVNGKSLTPTIGEGFSDQRSNGLTEKHSASPTIGAIRQ